MQVTMSCKVARTAVSTMRFIRTIQPAILGLPFLLMGCGRLIDALPYMDAPPYRDPVPGFSSSYHRALYGPAPHRFVAPASPATGPEWTSQGRLVEPATGYLLTEDRLEDWSAARKRMPGSRVFRQPSAAVRP